MLKSPTPDLCWRFLYADLRLEPDEQVDEVRRVFFKEQIKISDVECSERQNFRAAYGFAWILVA
jgi:hypothetical protein